MKNSVLCLLLLFSVGIASSYKNYEGYQVIRAVPRSENDIKLIWKIIDNYNLDVWQEPSKILYPVDVLVPPSLNEAVTSKLAQMHISNKVSIPDIQTLIVNERATWSLRGSGKAMDHTVYHTLTELMTYLDEVEASYPTLASSYVAGTTHEGRPIRVSKISSGGSDTRPVVWLDCDIHAREWVSPATCMWIIDQLTTLYGSDSEITTLVDAHDFHILPVGNPDGYEYSWTNDRMWRKNRVPNAGSACNGVDCNRNFDANFAGPGASDLPCSDTYHGPVAFSEAETQAIRDSINAIGSRLKTFYSIHAYSQYWMTPYGYTTTLPVDYTEMYRVAEISVNAATAVYGTTFAYGNIADVIYIASGSSVDWVYDALGTVHSFALELRDTGTFGFLLPPNQIIPTAEETWEGIKAGINAI